MPTIQVSLVERKIHTSDKGRPHHERVNPKSIAVEDQDWDFRGASTQYATHGMHTWLAAMIPGVASKLLVETRAKSVLDPFCGGGTALVESALHGIPCAGVD